MLSIWPSLKLCHLVTIKPFSKRQILDSSKMKRFADNNIEFDENGRKLSKWVENTVGKGEIARMSNFSFSRSVFKRLLLQKHKNQGLFGKGLNKRLLNSGFGDTCDMEVSI